MQEKKDSVSSERVGQELSKILTGNNPAQALRDLAEIGFIDRVLPELALLWNDERSQQSPHHHSEGNVWEHTLKLFEVQPNQSFNDGKISIELALAILFHDVGKIQTFQIREIRGVTRITNYGHAQVGADIAREVLTRSRFANSIIDRVCYVIDKHMTAFESKKFSRSTLKKFVSHEDFDLLLELHRRDIAGSTPDHFVSDEEKFASYNFLLESKDIPDANPKSLINGGDLIEAGFKAGPIFKNILDIVRNAQLEGIVNNKQQALQFVQSAECMFINQ